MQKRIIYVINIPNFNAIGKITITQQSPDGTTLYISNYNSRTVSVINTNTLATTATITVGINLVGLALSPDGNTLYAANAGSNNVSLINKQTQ